MTTETNWILEQLDDVVNSVGQDYSTRDGDPVEVIRINRNESVVFETDETIDMTDALHQRKEDLQRGVFIGAQLADRDADADGVKGDPDRIESVIGLRIEGLTHREWGHVDPAGENGVPFDVLTRRVRRVLRESLSYPDTNTPHTTYHDLIFTNESPLSWQYRDYYRYDVDAALRGRETLPDQ